MAKRSQQGKPWTADELKKLKKIFRNRSNKDAAKELKRGVDAVRIKANRIGLTKTKKYLKSIGRAK